MPVNSIQVPLEGQAIDISYLGKVVQTVDSLAEQFGDLSSSSTVVNDVEGTSKTVLTQMLNITAKTFIAYPETTLLSWSFPQTYQFPPVIVASVEGTTDLVYVARVSSVDATLKFSSGTGKPSAKCNVHAIAIGIHTNT